MNFIRGRRLGQGSFGTVNLAASRSIGNRLLPPLMAVKSCAASSSSSLVNEKSVLDEVKDCPEIINCFGDCLTIENGEELYNVLMEYAPGGSLAEKVKNSGDGRLPELEVRRYTAALLRGLDYLHKFGYAHCDIKLQNILLDSNGGLKIADLGLAKRISGTGGGCELRGTPLYMSPEAVSGGDQGAAADIWAVGCVVSEMITGAPAWKCSNVAELLMSIGIGDSTPEIPGILSEEGKDFLRRCFVKDFSKRWTAEMLLRHPFVCGVDEGGVAAPRSRDENILSVSPRCPLDFSEWGRCSITPLPSPGWLEEGELWLSEGGNLGKRDVTSTVSEQLRSLASRWCPDWSVSEDWITVR